MEEDRVRLPSSSYSPGWLLLLLLLLLLFDRAFVNIPVLDPCIPPLPEVVVGVDPKTMKLVEPCWVVWSRLRCPCEGCKER